MKKVFWIVPCIVGMLFVSFGGIMKVKENAAVSIVGGADGPTSVFVAGKLNGNLAFKLIMIGIVLLGVAVIAFFKRKH
jgi:Na+-transporting methylmalonyl-CoA/oxaloacetate decarboxylase beta subunit